MSRSDDAALPFTVKLLYVVVPLTSWAVSLPIVLGVLPHEVSSGQIHFEFWLIGAAALFGAGAAPGYVYALVHTSPLQSSSPTRHWVQASLATGVITSAVGAVFAYFAFWPVAILPLASIAMCLHLSRLLAKTRREGA